MPPEGTSGENIYFDEDDIPEEDLIDLLVPYIRLGKDTGRVVVTSKFDDLESYSQVVVLLLAQHLRKKEDEWVTPSEIGELAHQEVEELYPSIRKLEQEEIAENDNGQYRLPTSTVEEAMSKVPSPS